MITELPSVASTKQVGSTNQVVSTNQLVWTQKRSASAGEWEADAAHRRLTNVTEVAQFSSKRSKKSAVKDSDETHPDVVEAKRNLDEVRARTNAAKVAQVKAAKAEAVKVKAAKAEAAKVKAAKISVKGKAALEGKSAPIDKADLVAKMDKVLEMMHALTAMMQAQHSS